MKCVGMLKVVVDIKIKQYLSRGDGFWKLRRIEMEYMLGEMYRMFRV